GETAAARRACADELGLATAEVRAARAEARGRGAGVRGSFDLVTARACAALPVLAEYALPLLAVNGTLVAWKGSIADDEMRAGAAAAGLLGGGAPVVEPAGRDELGDHRFVLIRKERPTPEGYPRRPGVPARRPLPG